jgi:hypothetical protein
VAEDDNEGNGFPLPQDLEQDESPYALAEPRRRDSFKAWHRPRKQYVRDRQWTNAINDILSGRDSHDRLKYIGLPGIDLLDLRHIVSEVCEPSGRVLEFVGYDIAAGGDGPLAVELNISEAELKAHPLVHQPSLIRPDDFRLLASTRTAAWRAAEQMAPADVINMDLTGHLFEAGTAGGRPYEAAVLQLFMLQVANPRPWLLLLTTKVDRETAAPGKLRDLAAGLERSLADCPDVRDLLAQHADTPFDPTAIGNCSDDDLRLYTVVGTLRWIYDVLMAGTVKTRPRLRSCFFYTSYETGGTLDMASLVIRFDRHSVDLDDATFGQDATPAEIDPCAELTRYVQRAANGNDIDAAVRADPELRRLLIERSGALLTQARYSIDAYRTWVGAYAS